MPQIDIFSQIKQVFQGPIPNISQFVVKNASKADMLVIPHDAAFWPKWYLRNIESWSSNIPILFFNRSDSPVVVKIPNGFSLQNSFVKSQKASQVIIPYNVLNLDYMPFRTLSQSPKISFVGFVPKLSPRRALSIMVNGFPGSLINNPIVVRRLGIRQIQKKTSNFEIVARSHYGGARSLIQNPELWRGEYEKSIENSDLVFCPRGDANSSQRLYEVISAGRIPVIPNTGQVLPKCNCSVNHSRDFLQISCSSSNLKQVIDVSWRHMTQDHYASIQRSLRDTFASCYRYDVFLTHILSEDVCNFRRFVC